MNGRVVILAHAHDAGASAVAAALCSRLGPHGVTIVRPEALGLAAWTHQVESGSPVQTHLRLPSGVTIESATTSCLFNRLQYLPTPRFSRASPKDREYAGAELQALVASWLYGLGQRVVNPAGPRGLARGPVSQRGWRALAAATHMPVARSIGATSGRMIGPTLPSERVVPRETWPGGIRGPVPVDIESAPESIVAAGEVIVVGGRTWGPLAAAFGDRSLDVARRAGCALLEFRFGRVHGELELLAVDPLPALSTPWAVAAVAQLLEETRTAWEEGH